MLHILRVIASTAQAHLRTYLRFISLFSLLILSACSSRLYNAPVFDRSANPSAALGVPAGYYRVKTGDTLYRIAVENGQSYQAIATWNNLQNPQQIEVGQLLQVAPSASNIAIGAHSAAPQGASLKSQVQPFNGAPIPFTPTTNPNGTSDAASPATDKTASIPPAANTSVGNIVFAWPASGPVLETFDETKNKGVDIGGTAGAAVRAAAGGRVVYAGNGLRGYGNLIIIKHDNLFLSAYAHNRLLHAKEGDIVQKGQKIAEMGSSDAQKVMLHFEIRKQGKPVDPLKYLPASDPMP